MLSTAEVQCPYCGESITLLVDPSAGSQCYIEDCQVCCKPMTVVVAFDDDGEPLVTVAAEDEV
jgi:hypothetical protein